MKLHDDLLRVLARAQYSVLCHENESIEEPSKAIFDLEECLKLLNKKFKQLRKEYDE